MLYQNRTKMIRDIVITEVFSADDAVFNAALKADLSEMFGTTYYQMHESDVKFNMYFRVSVDVPLHSCYQRVADMVAAAFGEFTDRFAKVGKPQYRVWTQSGAVVRVEIDIDCVREVT